MSASTIFTNKKDQQVFWEVIYLVNSVIAKKFITLTEWAVFSNIQVVPGEGEG